MKIVQEEIRKRLREKGLKVTPQRMAILEVVSKMRNHPTAESITEQIRTIHPGIATGTIYKILETFVDKELIKKVNTDRDIMRYDGSLEKHHHLYCAECNTISDYYDEYLDRLLENYFKNKNIPGFQIEEFELQLKGRFDKSINNPDSHNNESIDKN